MRILITAIQRTSPCFGKAGVSWPLPFYCCPSAGASLGIDADSKGRRRKRRKRKTSLAVNNRAAIGMEHLPGHIRAIPGSQENIAGGDFIRLSGPFHGNILAELGDFIGRKSGR